MNDKKAHEKQLTIFHQFFINFNFGKLGFVKEEIILQEREREGRIQASNGQVKETKAEQGQYWQNNYNRKVL